MEIGHVFFQEGRNLADITKKYHAAAKAQTFGKTNQPLPLGPVTGNHEVNIRIPVCQQT